MSPTRRPLRALLLCAAVLASRESAAGVAVRAADEAPPRLVVLVVVDQLRRDMLDRHAGAFGEGGFQRLLEEGAVFPDAAFPFTVTSTGPGHAAVATGCLPAKAGIPENSWLDRSTGAVVGCVEDASAPLVGSGVPEQRGVSARHLQQPTLGDHLQRTRGEQALVVSVAWKDRSAVLLGGAEADAVVWVDMASGRFTTSTAWPRDGAPPELASRFDLLLTTDPLAGLAGDTWQPSLPDERARELAGPDAAPGEPPQVFPHPLGDDRDRPAFTGRVFASPFGDRVVLDAARLALRSELGRDDVPDLLCVGFPSLDAVGHAFGPDSREYLDTLLGVDRCLASLLEELDREIGAGRWSLALTADHGIAPLPEQSGGVRVDTRALAAAVEAALRARFGAPPLEGGWVQGLRKPSLYLDERQLDAWRGGRTREEALQAFAAVAAAALEQQTGVLAAGSPPALAASDDSARQALARDAHPTRSGHVLFLLQPYAVAARSGTNHGTHHDYDRQVPVLLLGRGIAPGRHDGPATPLDLAPTLAALLGLPPLPEADGKVLAAALARDR